MDYSLIIFYLSLFCLFVSLMFFLLTNKVKVIKIDKTDTKISITLPKEYHWNQKHCFLLKVENSEIVKLYQLSSNFNLEKSSLIKNIGILKYSENNENISDCYLSGVKTEQECLHGAIQYISSMFERSLKI